MKTITGRTNPAVMLAASLKDKKNRDETGLLRFEGRTMLEELIQRKRPCKSIFVTARFFDRNTDLVFEAEKNGYGVEPAEVYLVTDGVYDKITEQSSPDGVLCICEKKHFENICDMTRSFDGKGFIPPERSKGIMICEDIRDPGNVGTVIRSAAAFGTDAVFLCGCADIYSQKTLRAAMGAAFTTGIYIFKDISDAVRLAKSNGYTVIATALHRDAEYVEYGSLPERCAVMIGSEGSGLSEEAIALSDKKAVIKTEMESLNAASAATLFIYLMSR
ncbi:MAG: RNA methyltransferase [Ruminococcaceae bacterium]|nr:RNA methyltransferase [Oscillospiraceae bacterium]